MKIAAVVSLDERTARKTLEALGEVRRVMEDAARERGRVLSEPPRIIGASREVAGVTLPDDQLFMQFEAQTQAAAWGGYFGALRRQYGAARAGRRALTRRALIRAGY